MKKAILYARVSTDRQAEHGHSREEQVERMQQFCVKEGYEIVKVYLEDYSAKNFDRPVFKEILNDLKNKRVKVDTMIVPKIDRFTRNVPDTFGVLAELYKYNVMVLSIADGEMDFNNVNKFFPLLIQTGAAQHDNMVRSQNVKRGMRQGMKKGHFMAKPPKGYKRDKETNLLVFDPPLAEIVQWAFKHYAKGVYSAEEVRRIAKERGLDLQKQAFLNMLANVLYIGKILVPKTKEEPEEIVQGLHEALIDEHTFYTVQSILKGKRKPYKESKDSVIDALPLRGHLICPKCKRTLTGSINQNRPNGNRIPYYHCQTNKYACNHRINANNADKLFKEYLQTFQPAGEVVDLFTHVLNEIFNTNDADRLGRKRQLEAEIERKKDSINNMDYKLADGGITDENYSRIIAKLNFDLNELVMQHATFAKVSPDLNKYVNYSIGLLQNLSEYYTSASPSTKHKLVGVIFPEKLTFKENWYYTTKTNEVFSLICSMGKDLKEDSPAKIARLYSLALPSGLEPETL